jgi:signal transduction histidine kinase
MLSKVFEPFVTTKAKGMGIGLAVSRTIVEAHGGKLWAQNNAQAGATFRFTLPVAAGA